MATETRRPSAYTAARRGALAGARPMWLLAGALLAGCGGEDTDDDGVVLGDDGPVQLSVFSGCENEFHGSCDVLDVGCQERVFSTARCLRQQPDAVLPVVRVISKDELIAELNSESAEVTETSGEDPLADAAQKEAVDRALQLLGLAQAGELSEESYVQVFVNTVPAFYSNEDDTITLVDGALGDDSSKTLTLLHELVHALQDQSLSLAALDTDAVRTFDAYLAALSIVEGEAAMLQSFVEAAGWSFEQDPDFRKSYTSWVPAAEAQFAGQSPLLVSPRYFPYSYGARFVFDVFASESAAGVRARYEAPPVSVLPMLLNESGPVATEPESLLDLPEPNAPAGFVRHEPDSFGPWVFGKFVELMAPELFAPELIESNLPRSWRGDRFLAWSSEELGVAALWTLRLDSLEAANELFGRLQQLTLLGLPSANAFCSQSGRDVTLGVTENMSSRDLWAASAAAASSAAASASASVLPSATPSIPPAGGPSFAAQAATSARRKLPRSAPWHGPLSRLAQRAH